MIFRTPPPLVRLLAGLAGLLAGCRHAPMLPMDVKLGGGAGDMTLTAPPVNLPLPMGKPRQVNSRWLFGDEFFPPGARRIFPPAAATFQSRETPQTKYPSMEVLPSPDGTLTLFSDSGEAKKVMVHWLMVYRQGEAQPTSLFHTRNTYEVLWSADSMRAAITEFIGDNRSEVLIGDMRDYSRSDPLDVRAAAAAYFTSEQLEAPRFLRAQAFDGGARLLVRCVGQLAVAPFDQFGFEIVVDLSRLDDPATMTFVRGYVLAGQRIE